MHDPLRRSRSSLRPSTRPSTRTSSWWTSASFVSSSTSRTATPSSSRSRTPPSTSRCAVRWICAIATARSRTPLRSSRQSTLRSRPSWRRCFRSCGKAVRKSFCSPTPSSTTPRSSVSSSSARTGASQVGGNADCPRPSPRRSSAARQLLTPCAPLPPSLCHLCQARLLRLVHLRRAQAGLPARPVLAHLPSQHGGRLAAEH